MHYITKRDQINALAKLLQPKNGKSAFMRYQENSRGGLTLDQWLERIRTNLLKFDRLHNSKEFNELLKKIENGKLPF